MHSRMPILQASFLLWVGLMATGCGGGVSVLNHSAGEEEAVSDRSNWERLGSNPVVEVEEEASDRSNWERLGSDPVVEEEATADRTEEHRATTGLLTESGRIDEGPEQRPEMDEMELAVRRRLAVALTEEYEYAAAWPHLLALLELDQENPAIQIAAAQACLYWSLDRECVREHAARALELRPNDHRAHAFLGHVAQEEGDLEAAAHHYREVLSLRPQEAGIAVLLATILCDQGRRQEAEQALLESLHHNPLDGRLLLHLAVLVEPADPTRAEELFRQAAMLSEDPLFAYRHLLRFYQRQGRTHDAQQLQELMEALSGGPRQMRAIRK
ncbi:MAG: tetratricopeptide repeat protein [Bradymonadales bacterium]|nr:tetratricopeptide repeat protein [Bradymonadales bacterium]